jgi:hypothetical protein
VSSEPARAREARYFMGEQWGNVAQTKFGAPGFFTVALSPVQCRRYKYASHQ